MLEYYMTVKLMTEQHLEFLSLKGGCTGLSESMLAKCHIFGNHMSHFIQLDHDDISSESTLVKMPHCWKSHVTAHICRESRKSPIRLCKTRRLGISSV